MSGGLCGNGTGIGSGHSPRKVTSMNDPKNESAQADAAGGGHRLQMGQVVEVRYSELAGISGMLVGFSSNQNCLIELDTVQRGVILVIDPAAVRVTNTTPARPGICD